MTEMYCDILPADNGWLFTVNGYQSASYPSYEMAVRAAADYSDQIRTPRERVVIRRQNLRGQMTQVLPPAAAGTSGRGDQRAG